MTSVDEGESGSEYPPMIVGAVNLAASVDNEVLRHLHSATEYLYVSGMAVDINYRWVLSRSCVTCESSHLLNHSLRA